MSTKFVTIEELEQGDQKEAIWALNGSAKSDAQQVGDVHIGIPKLNGSKVDPLFLPQTWLPHRITDQIPRAQLLAASEFRQAVNSQLAILITDAYAKSLLASEGATEEKERLVQLKKTIREATAARSITQANTDIINTSEIDDTPKGGAERSANELDPAFEMFANNLVNKPDIEVMNLIRGRGKVTRREVKHLLHVLHDKPKTCAMLQARVASK